MTDASVASLVRRETVERARGHLYDAECALHAAKQTHVAAWISAAAEQLHRALVELDSAERAPRRGRWFV